MRRMQRIVRKKKMTRKRMMLMMKAKEHGIMVI